MATAAGLVALTVIAEDGGAAALLPLAVGALYVGGAIHGSRAVDKCKAEMSLFEADLAARNTLPLDEAGEAPRSRSAAVDAPPQPPFPVPVVQAPPLQPPPPRQQPAQPQPKQPASKQPAPAADDGWTDFWREVP